MRRLALALMLATMIGACAEGPPAESDNPSVPTPSTPTVAGTWTGSVPVQGGTARMTWTLTHSSATDVSGPVLISLTSGTVLANGFLTGTLTGISLAYAISVGPGGLPLSPTCVGQLGGTMTLTAGTTLTGDFALRSSSCQTTITSGIITLTKQ